MVFFICNHCGESLKKQVVGQHGLRCKRNINVSCMDCQKDFQGQAYDAHTSCISEAEKYSGKGFVAKVAKGVKKQEDWISKVRSIPERQKNLPRGVLNVFEVIKRNSNIPRKMVPFLNFFHNSNRGLSMKDVEIVWSLIEKETKAAQTPVETNRNVKSATNVPPKNGTTASEKSGETQNETVKEEAPVKQKKKKMKQSSENDEAPVEKKQKKSKNVPANEPVAEQPQPTKQKKRKTKDTAENVIDEEESHSSKQKKRKTKDSSQNGNENGTALNETNGAKAEDQEQNGNEGKFNFSAVIRAILAAQNNEMKLSKLKKKVMKRYQQVTGEAMDGKFESKFQKKLAKTGFVVENDTVRLVET